MVRDIEMKVFPSFIEDDCKIIFSFRFVKDKISIGEAVIHTYVGELFKKQDSLNTIAYCQEFSILEEYRNTSFKNIMDFLKIIGIKRFYFTSNGREEEKVI